MVQRNRLDEYLNTLQHTLSALPPEQQQGELAEIRSHLQAAIAARCELGGSEEAATTFVLQQFGPPQRLGRSLRRAFQRRRSSWYDTLLSAVILAFAALRISDFLTTQFWLLLHPYCAEVPYSDKIFMFLATSVLFDVAVSAGVGRVTPRWAIRGICLALPLRMVCEMSSFHGWHYTNKFSFVIYIIAALGAEIAWCAAGVWLVSRLVSASRRRNATG